MRVPRIDTMLWGSTLTLLAAGAIRNEGIRRQVLAPLPDTSYRVEAPPAIIATDTVLDAVERIGPNNMFRPDRASVDPEDAAGELPQSPRAARPQLSLKGVIGGPPWSAVIDGVPSRTAPVVVRLMDTIAGLRVTAIRRDTVIIRGSDTAWKLSLSRP